METIAPSGRHSFQWKSFLLVKTIPFQWKPFLVVESTPFSGSHSFQRKPFHVVEAIHFKGTHCPQWNTFLLVEAISFSRSCSFQCQLLSSHSVEAISLEEIIGLWWKQFLLVETARFDRWHFLYWKLFILLEAIHFIGSHSFQFFPQSLCFWWKSLPGVETNLFRRSLFFLVKAWWKLLYFIETFPFSGSHSFQCLNIFTSRSYQKLPEYLNINDSVRSLKITNLSWIHIPEEVFQNSECIQNPVEQLGCKVFNTSMGLFFYTVNVLLEFQHDH